MQREAAAIHVLDFNQNQSQDKKKSRTNAQRTTS
jgi:hypothetical protein